MKTMHRYFVVAASIAALLGAAAVSPALADGRHYRHHNGNRTGAYIGLGFGALALGALAYSASRPTYYYAPPAYYYPPPPPYPYYYGPPPAYLYDPYANTYVPDPQFDRPSN